MEGLLIKENQNIEIEMLSKHKCIYLYDREKKRERERWGGRRKYIKLVSGESLLRNG